MITIIHGEDAVKSRNFYSELKQKALGSQTFYGEKMVLTDLMQITGGQGLFNESPHVFIEDLFTKRKPGKELTAIMEYFKKLEDQLTITLWESKLLSPKTLQSLGKVTTHSFSFPKEIFAFLDNLKPGNGALCISQFHRILQTEEAEFVFFMVVRHIRILLALSESATNHEPTNNEPSEIDEVIKMAPWQKSKMQKQSKLFEKEKLLSFYDKLFDLEKAMKTGQLALPLGESVDFLLSSI